MSANPFVGYRGIKFMWISPSQFSICKTKNIWPSNDRCRIHCLIKKSFIFANRKKIRKMPDSRVITKHVFNHSFFPLSLLNRCSVHSHALNCSWNAVRARMHESFRSVCERFSHIHRRAIFAMGKSIPKMSTVYVRFAIDWWCACFSRCNLFVNEAGLSRKKALQKNDQNQTC